MSVPFKIALDMMHVQVSVSVTANTLEDALRWAREELDPRDLFAERVQDVSGKPRVTGVYDAGPGEMGVAPLPTWQKKQGDDG